MQLPEELVAQRCDDAIATCTEAINRLDLAHSDLKTLTLALRYDRKTDLEVVERLEKHLRVNAESQGALVFIRGQIHAAIHTMPDRKVVHLTEEVF